MMTHAGDIGLIIDFGLNQPGDILQRKIEKEWQNFSLNGELVVNPFDINSLPPGEYRLIGPQFKKPSTRELLDHIHRKRAEGYRPKRSVKKSINRRNKQATAEFLDSVSKQSK